MTPGGTSGSPEQQEEEAKYSKGDFQPQSNIKVQHLGGQNKVTFKENKSSGSPEQWKEEAKYSKRDFQHPRLRFTPTSKKPKEMIHSTKGLQVHLSSRRRRPNIQRGTFNPNSNALLQQIGGQAKETFKEKDS